MNNILLSTALFVLGLVFQSGNAASECPMPGESILVYMDMAQISLMKLQHDFTGVFQDPIKCDDGNDQVCVDKQRCCGKEVGCCSTNRTCGCKDRGSSKCSFPSPIAVLGKSECDAGRITRVVTCLRERRIEDDFHSGKNSTEQPLENSETSFEEMRILNVPLNVMILSENYGSAEERYDVEQLAQSLSKTMIDKLIKYVSERKIRGESYGLPE